MILAYPLLRTPASTPRVLNDEKQLVVLGPPMTSNDDQSVPFHPFLWFLHDADELEKCLEMAREVGGVELMMRMRRGERLIKKARSLEDAANDIDFEKFKFVSEDDN
ncbi:hypothetical protein Bca52824_013236 [Brassica carinata]|uniref:Uncharacterized protein n=1 Tax=Brassica carinata TaxID=52824 RepID=A0A8X7W0E9_BRACI|nr:hypothetical protein Bca52824_013236 [Brassica carinata]